MTHIFSRILVTLTLCATWMGGAWFEVRGMVRFLGLRKVWDSRLSGAFDWEEIRYIKAGTDYGTYSAAQLHTAGKNMIFASVDSQQTCCEHAMNMFWGRAVLPQKERKIVSFLREHKDIPCCNVDRVCQYMFVQTSEECFVQHLCGVMSAKCVHHQFLRNVDS